MTALQHRGRAPWHPTPSGWIASAMNSAGPAIDEPRIVPFRPLKRFPPIQAFR